MTTLIAGASGLIGSRVVALAPQGSLQTLGRRSMGGTAGVKQLVGPVEDWPSLIASARPTCVISALGTTMRTAGSKAAFRAVDIDLVLSVATAAKNAGARQFIMVSSVGASAASSNFYLKTKGEAEEAVRQIGFERVDIMRPGLLRGKRGGDARPGERLAIMLSPVSDFLTPAVLDQYRSIRDEDVAQAVLTLIGASQPGVHAHHNRDMLNLLPR